MVQRNELFPLSLVRSHSLALSVSAKFTLAWRRADATWMAKVVELWMELFFSFVFASIVSALSIFLRKQNVNAILNNFGVADDCDFQFNFEYQHDEQFVGGCIKHLLTIAAMRVIRVKCKLSGGGGHILCAFLLINSHLLLF